METSDFGKGFAYCLGLFLAHEAMIDKFKLMDERTSHKGEELYPGLWFNGSSDHLYEFLTEHAPDSIRERCVEFQEKVLSWGHGFGMDGRAQATWEDVTWSLQEAKDLLREYDLDRGIPAVKGEYE